MAKVEQEVRQKEEGHPTRPVTMYYKRGPDQGKYNNPLMDETVAVLFTGKDGAPLGFIECDTVVYPHGIYIGTVSLSLF